MTAAEWWNVAGIVLQLVGVSGLVFWYLRRVAEASEKDQRTGEASGSWSMRGTASVRLGPPTPEQRIEELEADFKKRISDLRAEVQLLDSEQRKAHERLVEAAKEREHADNRIGIGSSAAVIAGLVAQLVGALI